MVRRKFIVIVAAAVSVVVGLLVGLGVGLTRKNSANEADDEFSGNANGTSISSNTTNTKLWVPSINSTWDYRLQLPHTTVNNSIEVYDIDLFDSDASLIKELHDEGHHVICYFSAGSYENWRPDKDNFTNSDLGNNLKGWKGEKWLNTSSWNVRNIMISRMEIAVAKSCDGVDPDNLDGYDNANGFGLTEDDAVNYIEFLSERAKARNLSIGLKNCGSIVQRVVNLTNWVVVELCIQYDECDLYRPFIEAKKPVFNVEYPKGDSTNNEDDVTLSQWTEYCNYNGSYEFETILKNMDLDLWIQLCPLRESG